MAVSRKSGLLGSITGMVGGIVFTTWRTLNVVKSRPSRKKKSKSYNQSEKQIQQKSLFKTVMAFLSCVGTDVFDIGFQVPKKMAMTKINAATSYHIQHAVAGEYPDYRIDFAKLKFSQPIKGIENGWNIQFNALPGRMVEVKWDLNARPQRTTQLDDELKVVIFSTKRNYFICSLGCGTKRDGLVYSKVFNQSCVDDTMFCWVFFVSADEKQVSETEYLGVVKILA